MDGYPRTLAQAASFDQVLRQQFLDLDRGDPAGRARRGDRPAAERPLELSQAAARRPTTRASKPPRSPGVCDDCGTALVQRDDDREETVRAAAERLPSEHRGADPALPGPGTAARGRRRGRASKQVYRHIIAGLERQAGLVVLRSLFQRSPELKSPREIGLMREAGKLVAEALRLCRAMAKPGVRTIEIDRAVEALYAQHGAMPLFKGYPGPGAFPGRDLHLAQRAGGPRHSRPARHPRGRPVQDRHRLQAQRLVRRRGHHARRSARSARNGGGWSRWPRRSCRSPCEEMGRRKWWSEVAAADAAARRARRLQRGDSSTSATASAASCTRTRRCPTSSAARCASTISAWKRAWCWRSSRW